MGRYANALDWSGTDRASGVGPRAFPSLSPERSESEIRPRSPASPGGGGETFEQHRGEEQEPPTQRFDRGSGIVARSEIVPPSPFLFALGEVRSALEALVATAREARVTAALDAAIRSLVHVIGMWRTNLVRQVDELALGEDGELPTSSSLPEYSAAYTLAIVQPALKEAEDFAALEPSDDCVGLVQAVAASVERMNATLRYRND